MPHAQVANVNMMPTDFVPDGASPIATRPKAARKAEYDISALGPYPRTCLETFHDLGLSDSEIARYFGIPRASVTGLRLMWNIR